MVGAVFLLRFSCPVVSFLPHCSWIDFSDPPSSIHSLSSSLFFWPHYIVLSWVSYETALYSLSNICGKRLNYQARHPPLAIFVFLFSNPLHSEPKVSGVMDNRYFIVIPKRLTWTGLVCFLLWTTLVCCLHKFQFDLSPPISHSADIWRWGADDLRGD